MRKLNSKQEGLLAGGATALVLLTNVLNPLVSFIIAFVVLLAFAGYKLFQKS
jgi:ABC-type maltose transport system permease subunit